MTRYAQIIGGRAVAFFTTDRPASDFADIEIVEAAADVEAGWYLVDGVLQPKPERTLDQAKEEARQRIAAARYDAETGGTTFNGFAVDTSRDSRGNIQAIYSAAKDGYRTDPSNYKFADGVIRPLSNADAISMALTVLGFVQAQFDREALLLADIDAATTVDEADAVVW